MAYVTLSFDNGPDAVVTPQVLEVLRHHGIYATFFVVGKKLEAPGALALITRAHEEGHWIGNHTYSHSTPLGRFNDGPASLAEISRTSELIGPLAHAKRFFRPFGDGGILDNRILNSRSVEYLCTHRYSCITWNAVPRDWVDPSGWPDTALRQIERQDETLLVLHDIATGAMDHLDEFIKRAHRTGVQFRQNFPDDCKLIWEGSVMRDIDEFVTRIC
jgi:peptidoglycan/xylan/chitin deacetylase (PgdA/CDA1 family)